MKMNAVVSAVFFLFRMNQILSYVKAATKTDLLVKVLYISNYLKVAYKNEFDIKTNNTYKVKSSEHLAFVFIIVYFM